MALPTSVSFSILLFHLLPLLPSLVESNSPSSCPPFECAELGILEFPLSDNQPDCGLFMVNCTTSVESPHPTIRLSAEGTWYEILERYSSNSYRLRDSVRRDQLGNRSCFNFFNLSLPYTPSASFSFSPSLSLIQCFNGSHEEVYRYASFREYDCREYRVYYRDPTNVTDGQEIIVPQAQGCRQIELPRIRNTNQSSSDLFSLLTADFTLQWNVSTECINCHAREGQCSTNNMNGFLCRSVERGNSISSWTIVGSGLGALFTIVLVVVILLWKGRCSQRKDTLEYELRGVKFQTSSFTYHQIKTATQNFSPANKIGEGGFGPVYKGTFSDGTVVAVKQLSSRSRQGNREFVTEIGMISALEHLNLVKLYGCCVHGNNLLLIYEHMENNSLARALFGSEDQKLNLDWPTRHKICVGVARGLAFLHEESALKIVHRDIKASNVLLDGNLIPKISDFGLARLHEEDETHISTRIAGTLGYMAPEYALNGYLTDKADVYSFGVVLLEVVSGRANILMPGEEFNLLGWAKSLSQNDNVMELVDPRLESIDKEEILASINIALICTNFVGAERPSMSTVVSMLTGSSRASVSAPYLNLFHVRPPGQGFTLTPVRSKLMYTPA